MRHGVVPTPFAPHKTRDGEVVLRRGSSCPQTGPAARRLTWTDARDVAGRLEHVQIFDTADAMAQCAGIAPESARFAPDYSPVRRDDAVPFDAYSDAVPAFRDAARVASPSSRDAAVLTVALDGASRAAARRIAAQLVRHEAEHGATAALDATARCGRMLKRRVTPGVAAAVEGAAAATRVGDAVAPATFADIDGIGKVAEGAPLDRHVATAGDALLVVLTTAALRLRRQLGAFEASRREKKETSSACWRAATRSRRACRADASKRRCERCTATRSRSSTRARASPRRTQVWRSCARPSAKPPPGPSADARGPRAVRQTRATRRMRRTRRTRRFSAAGATWRARSSRCSRSGACFRASPSKTLGDFLFLPFSPFFRDERGGLATRAERVSSGDRAARLESGGSGVGARRTNERTNERTVFDAR